MLPESGMEEIEEKETSYKAYKLDFEKKRIGEIIDGREAFEQAVKLALMTQRYKYPVFSHFYGTDYSEVFKLKDQRAMGKLRNVIRDSLCCDERVRGVDNFSFERKGNKMLVSFRVLSIYGETENEIEVSE